MLSLITVKIQNIGNEGINKQVSYDQSALPGFKIAGSTVVKVDIVAASNEYLQSGVQLSRLAENTYVFAPIILDKSDYFVLKILAVHDESASPHLEAIGKIAGAQKTTVTATPVNEQSGYFSKALAGNATVQAARIIFYLFGGIAALIAIAFGITELSDYFSEKKRRRHTKNFERSLKCAPNKAQKCILDIYVELGEVVIVRLNQLLGNSEEVKREFEAFKARKQMSPSKWQHLGINQDAHVFMINDLLDSDIIGRLLENEVILDKDGVVSVNASAMEAARNFETLLLGVIPDKILFARGAGSGEPLGTESASPTPEDLKVAGTPTSHE